MPSKSICVTPDTCREKLRCWNRVSRETSTLIRLHAPKISLSQGEWGLSYPCGRATRSSRGSLGRPNSAGQPEPVPLPQPTAGCQGHGGSLGMGLGHNQASTMGPHLGRAGGRPCCGLAWHGLTTVFCVGIDIS